MRRTGTAIVGIFLVAFWLLGCSANWHAKQSQKHMRKAKMKDPDISFVDTVYVKTFVEIPKVKTDTVFHVDTDTIEVEKERLKIRYIRTTDSVYLSGECDSIYIEKEVPVTVEETVYIERLPKWWRTWGKWVAIGVGVLVIAGFVLRIVKPI